jgi:hypothetical protein
MREKCLCHVVYQWSHLHICPRISRNTGRENPVRVGGWHSKWQSMHMCYSQQHLSSERMDATLEVVEQ